VEQEADQRTVDAYGELAQKEAKKLIERSLPLLLTDERDPERVVEARAERYVMNAEHSFRRVCHDGPESLGDKTPGLGPAASALRPNEPKLGVVGVAAPGVEPAE